MKIIEVTPNNVEQETLFCIKDIKKPGFESKRKWFEKRYKEGLHLKILKDNSDKMLGFIEYISANQAWRPVNAENFMFIHCLVVYSKKDRDKGYGSLLINEAEKETKKQQMSGLCVMTSDGSWIANKTIFEKYGFAEVDRRGRFELLSKTWDKNADIPKLFDWTKQQKKYKGWHLVYADQCPWHEKSAFDLLNTAMDYGVDLKVTKINSAKEAKNAPSGYGVFNLLHDGKLLEDHYISATRFKNILNKEVENL
ncbi:N-acetyltransferase [Flavobacteriaceae bacterium S0825]|uniref:GNAT family N-acetyltransferase n=1 Tax=Pontimicrobium sp. SW4 TaxID=3153519 RepID=A0AAU7BWT4_9FLAO|nr:GNAT family N-acetyltransferase [Gaetbulibacter sp. S0825]MCK0109476.1 N-acetyltransferase [Flavobacteriaceae bacterium S0825]NIX65111.1 GNAT family N-acetyltransferase [Gaetbulibacter sp. S0825]